MVIFLGGEERKIFGIKRMYCSRLCVVDCRSMTIEKFHPPDRMREKGMKKQFSLNRMSSLENEEFSTVEMKFFFLVSLVEQEQAVEESRIFQSDDQRAVSVV